MTVIPGHGIDGKTETWSTTTQLYGEVGSFLWADTVSSGKLGFCTAQRRTLPYACSPLYAQTLPHFVGIPSDVLFLEEKAMEILLKMTESKPETGLWLLLH